MPAFAELRCGVQIVAPPFGRSRAPCHLKNRLGHGLAETYGSCTNKFNCRITAPRLLDSRWQVFGDKLSGNEKIRNDNDLPGARSNASLDRRFKGWFAVVQVANFDGAIAPTAAMPQARRMLPQGFACSAKQ